MKDSFNNEIAHAYGNLVREIHIAELNEALEMLHTFYEKHKDEDENNRLKSQVDFWIADILKEQGHLEEALAIYIELQSGSEMDDGLYTTYLQLIGSILILLKREEEAFTLIEDYFSKEKGRWLDYLNLLRWYAENLEKNQNRKLAEYSHLVDIIKQEVQVEFEGNNLKDNILSLANENKTANRKLMELSILSTKTEKETVLPMLTDYIASVKVGLYRQQAINLKEYLLGN